MILKIKGYPDIERERECFNRLFINDINVLMPLTGAPPVKDVYINLATTVRIHLRGFRDVAEPVEAIGYHRVIIGSNITMLQRNPT